MLSRAVSRAARERLFCSRAADLRAAANPTRFLHATDSLGTVAPGKLADLVLIDADRSPTSATRRRSAPS
jgi:cytosine/adenosine deaminase-related metal-dependent hydrolase